jgi:hypothetical protein
VNASVFTDTLNATNLAGVVSMQEWVAVLVDNCPLGYYCNETDGRPTACPAGTYQPETGAVSVDACVPCTAGHTCAAATVSPEPCPAGFFYGSTGADSDDCLPCSPGSFSGEVCSLSIVSL